jgi:hypothetical protein
VNVDVRDLVRLGDLEELEEVEDVGVDTAVRDLPKIDSPARISSDRRDMKAEREAHTRPIKCNLPLFSLACFIAATMLGVSLNSSFLIAATSSTISCQLSII